MVSNAQARDDMYENSFAMRTQCALDRSRQVLRHHDADPVIFHLLHSAKAAMSRLSQ